VTEQPRRVLNIRDYRKPGTKFPSYALPPNAKRIDRRSRWGNPYRIGEIWLGRPLDRDKAIELYREWLRRRLVQQPDYLEPLRGKDLACWCRPAEGFLGRVLCHGQVIAGLLYAVAPEAIE
jgi:hypothetical protein